MAKKISFGLSPREIDRAIGELENYRKGVLRKTKRLREEIARVIEERAQRGFMGALIDDTLRDDGTYLIPDIDVTISGNDNVSVVIAKGEDAVWIEFGTGVYHNGSAGSSPHPKGSELGMTIGGFGQGRGKRKTWGYYESGNLVLTRGTPAAMPMYRTFMEVCPLIDEIAKEVFRDDRY